MDKSPNFFFFFLPFFFSCLRASWTLLRINPDWLRSPPGGCRLTTGPTRNRADQTLTHASPSSHLCTFPQSFDFFHPLIQPITNNIWTYIRLGWQTRLRSSVTGVRRYNRHSILGLHMMGCNHRDSHYKVQHLFFCFFSPDISGQSTATA